MDNYISSSSPFVGLGVDIRMNVYNCLGYQSMSIAMLRKTCPWVKTEISKAWKNIQSDGLKRYKDNDAWLIDATQLDGYKLDVIRANLSSLFDTYHWNYMIINAIKGQHWDDVMQLLASSSEYFTISKSGIYSTLFLPNDGDANTVARQILDFLELQNDCFIRKVLQDATPAVQWRIFLAAITKPSIVTLEALPRTFWDILLLEMHNTHLDQFISALLIGPLMAVGKKGFCSMIKYVLSHVQRLFGSSYSQVSQLEKFCKDLSDTDEVVVLAPFITKSICLCNDYDIVENVIYYLLQFQEMLVEQMFKYAVDVSNMELLALLMNTALFYGYARQLQNWRTACPNISIGINSILDVHNQALHVALLQGPCHLEYLVDTYIAPLGQAPLVSFGQCVWSDLYVSHYEHVGHTTMLEFDTILKYLKLQYSNDHVSFRRLFTDIVISKHFYPAVLEQLVDLLTPSLFFDDTSLLRQISLGSGCDKTFNWINDKFGLQVEHDDASKFVENQSRSHRQRVDQYSLYFSSQPLCKVQDVSDANAILCSSTFDQKVIYRVVSRLAKLGACVKKLFIFYSRIIILHMPPLIDEVPDDSKILEHVIQLAVELNQVNVVKRLIARGVVINSNIRHTEMNKGKYVRMVHLLTGSSRIE